MTFLVFSIVITSALEMPDVFTILPIEKLSGKNIELTYVEINSMTLVIMQLNKLNISSGTTDLISFLYINFFFFSAIKTHSSALFWRHVGTCSAKRIYNISRNNKRNFKKKPINNNPRGFFCVMGRGEINIFPEGAIKEEKDRLRK